MTIWSFTLPGIHMEVENGLLEDHVLLPTGGEVHFHGPVPGRVTCLVSSGGHGSMTGGGGDMDVCGERKHELLGGPRQCLSCKQKGLLTEPSQTSEKKKTVQNIQTNSVDFLQGNSILLQLSQPSLLQTLAPQKKKNRVAISSRH